MKRWQQAGDLHMILYDSRQRVIVLLRTLLTMFLLISAGVIGWVVQYGDSSGNAPSTLTYYWQTTVVYMFFGLLIGMVNPRNWKLAGLAVWAAALSWTDNTLFLRDTFDSAELWMTWSIEHLFREVFSPLLATLLGGYVGARATSRFRLR